MAKRKTKEATKAKTLTDQQVDELAQRLHTTTSNVYVVAEARFGVKVGDEIFERLESVGKVFRCMECNVWHTTDRKLEWLDSVCDECDPDNQEEE